MAVQGKLSQFLVLQLLMAVEAVERRMRHQVALAGVAMQDTEGCIQLIAELQQEQRTLAAAEVGVVRLELWPDKTAVLE
jgi:hypothetical protein